MSNIVEPNISTNNFFVSSAINFTISFARMGELSFVVQEANLPDIIGSAAIQGMPGTNIHRPPDKLEFQPLSVKFLVDEEFRAHREMHDWLIGSTGGSDRFKNVAEFIEDQSKYIWPDYDKRKTYARTVATSASLMIVNANKIPVVKAVFTNVMITALTGVHFSILQDPLVPLTATATFAYDYYDLVTIKK